MESFASLLRQGRREDIWQRHCGFLDLDVHSFVAIQERLLQEQLNHLDNSPLAHALVSGAIPRTVAGFRRQVRLSTYDDYEPYLRGQNASYLTEEPLFWARTSGRSGAPKWIPYTRRMFDVSIANAITIGLLACARRRGEVRLQPGDKWLHNTAPTPYISGWLVKGMARDTDFRFMPPHDQVGGQNFNERIEQSFQMALREGIDVAFSLSSILMRIGDRFAEGGRAAKLSRETLRPAVLGRLLRGLLHSRAQGRALKPSDLWSLKGMLIGGMDTSIFRAKLTDYWGVEPHETYAATECSALATQAWTRKGLYFLPDTVFLEFIPEQERAKSQADPTYIPETVLLNQVEPGHGYEVVLTQFHGGPLFRYRMQDLVRFVADGEPEAGIRLPSMVFERGTRDLIDIAQVTGPMDEKQIWQAIVNTGIHHQDWTARKEEAEGKPVLRLYIEPEEPITEEEARQRIHQSLGEVNADYANFETMAGYHPLRITILPQGAFAAYANDMLAQGADLAHLKPPHMNAPDNVVETLLNGNMKANGNGDASHRRVKA